MASYLLFAHRVKALREEPYTQKEAEAAVGLRTDNGHRLSAKEDTQEGDIEMAVEQEDMGAVR